MKSTRPNEYTGNPRKWTCHDNLQINEALEALEALYTHWRSMRKRKSPLDSSAFKMMSKKLAWVSERVTDWGKRLESDEIAIRDSQDAEFSAVVSNKMVLPSLTADELRYCKAEGIDPEEFLKRKAQGA